ncbi:hypothetical protein [Candidatus Binatus sp.]|jgi:hypothetical protein|uniref:hypothetical protein n=1 Tax=Candidatus Binatus sp. TaxID=2811406 RepID=UPI002FDABE9D
MRKREIWLPDKIDEMALAQAQARGIDISAFYAGLLSEHLLNGQPVKSEALGFESGPGELSRPEDTVGSQDPISVGIAYPMVQRASAETTEEADEEVGGFVRDPNDPDRPYDECDWGNFKYVGPGKGDYVLTDNTGEDTDSSPPCAGTFEEVGPGQGDHLMTVGFSSLSLDVAKIFPGFPIRSIRWAQRIVNAATGIEGVVASEYKQKNGQKIGITFKPNFLMIEALLQRKSGVRVSIYGEPDQFNNKPSSLGRGRGRYSRIVVKSDEDLEKLLPLVRQAYRLKLGSVPDIDFV